MFFILLPNCLLSQRVDTLSVHTVFPIKSDPAYKVYRFESELFNKLIQLYNSKHKNKFYIKYQYAKDFNNLIKSLKTQTYSCAYGQITIGFLKKVEYSKPYFPVRNSLIRNKSHLLNFNGEKKNLVGLINHKYYKNLYRKLLKNYQVRDTIINENNYEDLLKLLKKGFIDCYIGDSIDAWIRDDIEIVIHIDDEVNYLGLLYPKNSELKEKLDDTISYYIKTNSFYSLLKKYFGNEFANYYRHTFEK